MSAAITTKMHSHGPYFAALDGFRGLLALFVAIYHTIWFSNINSLAFFDNGTVIIDLFFALSGFLMFYLYEDKLSNKAEVKSFMIKRFARLYPLHLFILVLFVAFALLRLLAHQVGIASHEVGEILPFTAGANEGWGSLLSHLTLTHAMGVNDTLSFNPPAWTISAEFFTYLAFVAIMLWVRPKKVYDFIFLGVVSLAIYAALSQLKPNMDITHDYAFFRCVAGFIIGMIVAKCVKWLMPKVEAFKGQHGSLLFSLSEAAILLSSTLFIIYCGGKGQFFVAPFLFVFMLVFAFDGGIFSRFMSAKVFRYLAKISYSTYMTHVLISIIFSIFGETVLEVFIPNWDNSIWFGDALIVVYLCCVIAFSHLTYHFIEVPGGRFIRNCKGVKSKKISFIKTA